MLKKTFFYGNFNFMISTLGTQIYTWIFGHLTGCDEFGNKYYEHKSNSKKRWVIYKGVVEASKVPASWYGWLHHTHDTYLENMYEWQKGHLPNCSYTPHAYKYSVPIDKIMQTSYKTYKKWDSEG